MSGSCGFPSGSTIVDRVDVRPQSVPGNARREFNGEHMLRWQDHLSDDPPRDCCLGNPERSSQCRLRSGPPDRFQQRIVLRSMVRFEGGLIVHATALQLWLLACQQPIVTCLLKPTL